MNHDDFSQFDPLMSPPSDEFRWVFWPISSSGDMPSGTERQPSKLGIFTLAQLGIINPVLTGPAQGADAPSGGRWQRIQFPNSADGNGAAHPEYLWRTRRPDGARRSANLRFGNPPQPDTEEGAQTTGDDSGSLTRSRVGRGTASRFAGLALVYMGFSLHVPQELQTSRRIILLRIPAPFCLSLKNGKGEDDSFRRRQFLASYNKSFMVQTPASLQRPSPATR